MGNLQYCECSNDDPPRPLPTYKLRNQITNLNDAYIIQAQKYNCPQQPDFLQFHQSILPTILSRCVDPVRVTMSLSSSVDNSHSQSHKMELYLEIKQTMMSKQNSIFNQLLSIYFSFLIKLFNLQVLPKTTDSSMKQHNEALDALFNQCSFSFLSNSMSQPQDQEFAKIIQGPRQKQLVQLAIFQINTMFLICRAIVYMAYGDKLAEFFGSTADDFPQKELFVQRLLQHFLLGKGTPLAEIYDALVESYYAETDHSIMKMSVMPELGTVLDQNFEIGVHLLPANGQDDFNISKDSFLEESSQTIHHGAQEDSLKSCKEKLQIQQILQKGEDMKDIPYMQTFPLMCQLMKCQKPWKKFLLIEKIEHMVSRIFLVNRSQSKFNEFEELLSAEDSKSDIFLFIIHKFAQKTQSNYATQLFNKLRFMNDFDGILHQDIKYIFCPSFIRFLSLLELYLGVDDGQRLNSFD